MNPWREPPLDNKKSGEEGDPFGRPSPGRVFKRVERLVRLAALLLLCGLVWWFSYDHGRSAARGRLYRLEAENISLRERVVVLENDLQYYKEKLKQAGLLAPSNNRPVGEVKRETRGEEAKEVPFSDNQAHGRLTVRLSENKSVFEDQAKVSLVELNSLDMEALVRVRHNDTGRREAMVMRPGDLFELEVGGVKRGLYLDQIKGSLAFFIIDRLPGDKSVVAP
jgi:hypothetical protein